MVAGVAAVAAAGSTAAVVDEWPEGVDDVWVELVISSPHDMINILRPPIS